MIELGRQRTLSQAVSYEGIALHSGIRSRLTLRPAPPDTGYVFVRGDLAGRPHLSFTPGNTGDTVRNTTVEKDGVRIRTVEHVLAALAGLEVDNCLIEVFGEEPPVGDGSALRFALLIKEAGLVEQNAPRVVRSLREPIYVSDGDRYLAAFPSDEYRISFVFVTDHPVIGTQYCDFTVTPDVFHEQIAPARTIGFLEQVEALKRSGLALGGSMEIAVVLDKERVLTPMRFPDEIVRHKVLDIIGDLAVLGPFRGHIIAAKSGHALNSQLAKRAVEVLI